MKHGLHDGPYGDEDSLLADEVEGYLLAHVHHDQARREAEDLCARMRWLTAEQAEDLTRHYVRRRIGLSRQMLLATVQRAGEPRQEYESRYASDATCSNATPPAPPPSWPAPVAWAHGRACSPADGSGRPLGSRHAAVSAG